MVHRVNNRASGSQRDLKKSLYSAPSKRNQQVSIRPIGIVVYDGVELMDLTGPMEVISLINECFLENRIVNVPVYPIQVIAKQPGIVTTSGGIQIYADRACRDVDDEIDTLLIPGSNDVDRVLADCALREWVCSMYTRVRRFVSACTGTFLLAEAGLLDGKRATCHWAYCDRLASDYPLVKIEPERVLLRDGSVLTSAGGQPGFDLVLSLVEEDWGSGQASLIAEYMDAFLRSRGGPSRFQGFLDGQSTNTKDYFLTEDFGGDAFRARYSIRRSHLSDRN